ncbi:MAG TPA: hypothetical protein VMU87_05590 [Stellaceae bacterium]|nr:hypothetical protein [Stellaceae bacterium]
MALSASGDETRDRRTRNRVWMLALAAAVLAALPVIAARHLPLLDAPAHEARLAVLRDLLVTGRGSAFYDLSTFFLPNIAFDLIGLKLVGLTDPETAGRIFFGLTLALTLWGVLALNRVAIGRWSAAPLAASLLLYNLISILGFFSYAFGLALVPWALAARLKLERAALLFRFLAGAILALILLFCHVFDFGIYALMTGGFMLAALIDRRIGLVQAGLWAFESVPALALYLVMSGGAEGRVRYEPHFFMIKLFGIVKSVTSGSMTGDIAFVIGALLVLVLAFAYARTRLAWPFVPGLVLLGIAYFALPSKLASGSYVDERMPIAVALLTLAGLDMRVRRSTVSDALVAAIGLTLIVKQTALMVLWRSFDPIIDSIEATLDRLPDGAVVMQAECQPDSNDIKGVYRERQPSVTHLPALAAFDDTRFIPSIWAIAGQHSIRVKPAYRPWYDLFWSFPASICSAAGYRSALRQTEGLADQQAAAGRAVPPLYFLLLRPPEPGTLAPEATPVATGTDYELYAMPRP